MNHDYEMLTPEENRKFWRMFRVFVVVDLLLIAFVLWVVK